MRRSKPTRNVSRCHVCGGKRVKGRVDQPLHLGGRWYMLKDVPVRVCTRCGERVADARIGHRIGKVLRQGRKAKVQMTAVRWPGR